MRGLIFALAASTMIAGCATGRGMNESPAGPAGSADASAAAEVRASDGILLARATAFQLGDGIRVRVEAAGMRPGAYGVHMHAVGRCDGPDFTSAGPHWNPTGQEHGKNNPEGLHKGDLPNLSVGTDGRGSFEVTIPRAWVRGGAAPLLDTDGAAVVIHAAADDYRTDPSGNSGARIACGVLG